MPKRFLAFVILLYGSSFAVMPAVAQKPNAVVIATNAAIRDQTNSKSKLLTSVSKGTKLLVAIADVNGWYLTSVNGKMGWIHGNTIRFLVSAAIQKRDEWIYYASSSDRYYYYNPSRTRRTGSSVTAWSKEVYQTTESTAAMIQYEFFCGSDSFRLLGGSEYRSDGGSYRSWPRGRIQVVIPETTLESLYRAVCR